MLWRLGCAALHRRAADLAAQAGHVQQPLHRQRCEAAMCDYTPGQLTGRSLPPLPLPQDIIAISARPYGQRAVLKFANYTGAKSTVGRHTPGAMPRRACCAWAGLLCCPYC